MKTEHRIYGELKTKITMGLTPSSIEKLRKLADERGISCSEFVERLIRKQTAVPMRKDG
jgi:predicted DNA binding CopG/RHH family protein